MLQNSDTISPSNVPWTGHAIIGALPSCERMLGAPQIGSSSLQLGQHRRYSVGTSLVLFQRL